ncbi:MAG: molybdate ABC transporter substrate-binding protein, partial [Candidatus Zixiibacteriota bacterium]
STGTVVNVSYGASGTLAQQIRAGAQVDLFLSADTAWIERLAADDNRRIAAWWPFLGNRLAVFTHVENEFELGKLDDLLALRFQRIAIADPGSAPVGRYAQGALRTEGIEDSLSSRLVYAENATAVVSTVRAHLADAGIAYTTDVAGRQDIALRFLVPETHHPPIIYGLAILNTAHPAAKRLAELLRSSASQRVFASAGFTPLDSAVMVESPQ